MTPSQMAQFIKSCQVTAYSDVVEVYGDFGIMARFTLHGRCLYTNLVEDHPLILEMHNCAERGGYFE